MANGRARLVRISEVMFDLSFHRKPRKNWTRLPRFFDCCACLVSAFVRKQRKNSCDFSRALVDCLDARAKCTAAKKERKCKEIAQRARKKRLKNFLVLLADDKKHARKTRSLFRCPTSGDNILGSTLLCIPSGLGIITPLSLSLTVSFITKRPLNNDQ